MQIFKLIFALSLSTLIFANDELVGSSFVGLNAGYAFSQSSKEGSIEPNFEIEDSGPLYGVEIGYRASENVFYSMNYSKLYFESRSFDNFYLTANYIFDLEKEKFSLYVGALAGSSSILWREDPVDAVDSSERRSSNYLVGAQVGFEYTINPDLFLHYSYVYAYSPQDTLLYDTTTLADNHRHNFVIGFRYYINNAEAGKK